MLLFALQCVLTQGGSYHFVEDEATTTQNMSLAAHTVRNWAYVGSEYTIRKAYTRLTGDIASACPNLEIHSRKKQEGTLITGPPWQVPKIYVGSSDTSTR